MVGRRGAAAEAGPDRYRLSLSPGGAGVLTLFFPGLLVALATGQLPLAALSLGAAVVLAANAVWARLALRRIEVRVEGPAAVTVGTAVALRVSLTGPRAIAAHLWIDGGVHGPMPAPTPGSGPILWRAGRRGVVDRVTVRVQVSVPLGLTAVVRVSSVPVLVRPGSGTGLMHAAPAAEPVTLPPVTGTGPGTPAGDRDQAASGQGDPVGLRRYRMGDTGRDVHWPTVARTGALMVRDRQEPAGQTYEVVVLARSGSARSGLAVPPVTDDGLDQLAARTRGVVEALRDAGHRVVLHTWEQIDDDGSAVTRPVTAPVWTGDDMIRRLARLGPGPGPGPGHRSSLEPVPGWAPTPSEVGPGARLRPTAAEDRVLLVDGNGVGWA